MAKKSYTIDEVKKAKIAFEEELLGMVQDFEKEYGVRLSYFNLERRRDEDMAPTSEAERGPVVNVEANMELDLIY